MKIELTLEDLKKMLKAAIRMKQLGEVPDYDIPVKIIDSALKHKRVEVAQGSMKMVDSKRYDA